MDCAVNWSKLPKCPSLKNLTDGKFGLLRETQEAAVQDLTKAHIESFDQAVTDGLNRAVQVCGTFFLLVIECKHTSQNVFKTCRQRLPTSVLISSHIS